MIAAFALAGVLTRLVAFLRSEDGALAFILIAVFAGCPFVAGYVGGGF